MKEIRSTTDIHSTPEKVWGVLTDFGAYPQWNPFITKAGGALEPGEQLELQLEPPGSHPRMLRPTLLEADPTRELRWHGRLGVLRLLEAYHTVSIVPKGGNRTHVIARTTFSGPIVALFEVAYQFAISGVGVAGAAALLYTAPVIVTILARVVLGEALTAGRLALAVVVMAGVALTVHGGSNAGADVTGTKLAAGVAGGLLAAVSYAATTLLGRWATPRYGVFPGVLLPLAGGAGILAAVVALIAVASPLG